MEEVKTQTVQNQKVQNDQMVALLSNQNLT